MSLFGSDRPTGRVMNANDLANFLRAEAIADDARNHDMRELAFELWCKDTVFPMRVDRELTDLLGSFR